MLIFSLLFICKHLFTFKFSAVIPKISKENFAQKVIRIIREIRTISLFKAKGNQDNQGNQGKKAIRAIKEMKLIKTIFNLNYQ